MDLDLNGIMNQLATEKGIFISEAQFQFELAWAIKKNYPSYDILLEYLSMTGTIKNETVKNEDSKEKKKRFYTDIIVKSNNEFIPIELKYKTGECEDTELLQQGATNLGRYDYLYDLYRVQLLKERIESDDFWKFEYMDKVKLATCEKGFAILLTNEPAYWNTTKKSLNNKTPFYKDFCIGDTETITKGSRLKWPECANSIRGTARDKALSFKKEYTLNWLPYLGNEGDDEKGKHFQYLILEC